VKRKIKMTLFYPVSAMAFRPCDTRGIQDPSEFANDADTLSKLAV
jgi:hypothetical protein